jgi:hypothetical protein
MRVSRDAAATARERHPPANARRNETDTRAVSRARGCFFGIQETDLYPPPVIHVSARRPRRPRMPRDDS